MDLIAIIAPFFSLVLLVVLAKRALWQAGLFAFILAAILWPMSPQASWSELGIPVLRGLLVTWDIALILLGAIGFLEFLQATGRTSRIKNALLSMTAGNQVVLVLLMAWLFCGFIEGAAGFGTPAAIVAPLLLSLGFSPVLAAVLPLIGDSTAVPFGAVGTPIRVGLDGLPVQGVAQLSTAINLLAGIVPVLAIVWLVARQNPTGQQYSLRSKVILALQASLSFTVPAFALSFLGVEFPSLIGSLCGILIFLGLNRSTREDKTSGGQFKELILAFYPYLLLSLGLLLGKVILGDVRLRWTIGEEAFGISLFQPGLVFLLVLVLLKRFAAESKAVSLQSSLAVAARRLPTVALAIFCMASLAQFMMAFADISQWISRPSDEALGLRQYLLVAVAPFIGVLGSFISGSATVSNLLFASMVADLALLFDLPVSLLLALQLIGAGIGNMIALQNLAAVQATVGLKNAEREMLKNLILPCFSYALVVSLVGLLSLGIWRIIT